MGGGGRGVGRDQRDRFEGAEDLIEMCVHSMLSCFGTFRNLVTLWLSGTGRTWGGYLHLMH